MADTKATRLSKIAREFNVGISTIVDFLHKKGEKVDSSPNTKISSEQYEMLLEEFSSDLSIKKETEKLNLRHLTERHQSISIDKISEGQEETNEEQEELIIKDTGAKSPSYEEKEEEG